LLAQAKADRLHANQKTIDSGLVEAVHRGGKKIAAWGTIVEPQVIDRLIGAIWYIILSPANSPNAQLFELLGKRPIFWWASDRYIRGLLVATDIWRNAGYGTIIYLASIMFIDPNLYEAALIDGANRWQQTWYVTLAGIRQMQIGYAMAVSLFKAAVGLSLVLLSNWIANKIKEEGCFSREADQRTEGFQCLQLHPHGTPGADHAPTHPSHPAAHPFRTPGSQLPPLAKAVHVRKLPFRPGAGLDPAITPLPKSLPWWYLHTT